MANTVIDVLPVSWFKCELKEQVIDFLRRLPIDPEDRKTAFWAWCGLAGCECDARDVERVTGLPAGEI